MNSLNQESLYNLIYSAMDLGDNLFELWLTVTFAAILAIYFSRDDISPFMRKLLIALYSGTALLLTGRWNVAMMHIMHYMDELKKTGLEPFPTPMPLGLIMGYLHAAMFIGGSLATIYFMYSYRGAEK